MIMNVNYNVTDAMASTLEARVEALEHILEKQVHIDQQSTTPEESKKKKKWYAIASGEWLSDEKRFDSGITTEFWDFIRRTERVFKPTSKVCKSEIEANEFLNEMKDAAQKKYMDNVHNGMFGKNWYCVIDEEQEFRAITHDVGKTNTLVLGNKQRKRKCCRTVREAMDYIGENQEYAGYGIEPIENMDLNTIENTSENIGLETMENIDPMSDRLYSAVIDRGDDKIIPITWDEMEE